MHYMLSRITLFVLLLPQIAYAAIYTYVDDNGQTHFTDAPPGNQEIQVIERDLKYAKPTHDENGVLSYSDRMVRPVTSSQPTPTTWRALPVTTPTPRPVQATQITQTQPQSASGAMKAMTDGLLQLSIKMFSTMLSFLLIAIGIKVLFLAKIKGAIGEIKVKSVLDSLGYDTLHDVILPISDGKTTQIDHLVNTPVGIVVIETKHYKGLIYGSDKDATWTQVQGKTKNKFQNPKRQNYMHTQAVEALVPGVPVHSLVVFSGSAKFPKGNPMGVFKLASLANQVRQLIKQPDTDAVALDKAWEKLKSIASKHEDQKKAHVDALKERHGGKILDKVGYAFLVSGMVIATIMVVGIF